MGKSSLSTRRNETKDVKTSLSFFDIWTKNNSCPPQKSGKKFHCPLKFRECFLWPQNISKIELVAPKNPLPPTPEKNVNPLMLPK